MKQIYLFHHYVTLFLLYFLQEINVFRLRTIFQLISLIIQIFEITQKSYL